MLTSFEIMNAQLDLLATDTLPTDGLPTIPVGISLECTSCHRHEEVIMTDLEFAALERRQTSKHFWCDGRMAIVPPRAA